MKYQEKLLAIELRKHGKSYSEILQKIKVSKATLSLWLRDVELSEKQKHELYVTRARLARYKASKVRQQKRIDSTCAIVESAKQEAKIRAGDPFFVAGVMLYWAEGSKSELTEKVQFVNSDPTLVRIMMDWFRKYCETSESKFRVCIHLHTLHCNENLTEYWASITNIPFTQFNKSQIKPTALKHRKNKLYNGTCSVRINDVNLFRRIKGWKLGIAEYF